MAFLFKIFHPKIHIVLDLIDTRDVFFSKFFKKTLPYLFNKTDLIFITSPKYATDYLTYFNLNDDDTRLIYVPNAPLYSFFKNFKRKQGGELTIGYIGAFRGIEAISNLVKIIKDLRDERFSVSVYFAGMGIDKLLVEKLAKKYDFVTYYGPFNYEKEVKGIYANVDILFSMYYLDNNKMIHLGCRFHDAVVCRIPIIVQAGTYMAELVKKNQVGYVIEFGKWDQLKDLFRTLCLNKNDLEEKSKNCEKVLKENCFETYEPIITNAYDRLLRL